MQYYLRNREHFEKRTDADIERSCASKDAYPSEAHARAVAAMNKMGDVLYTYQCFYCKQWHLTRRSPYPGRLKLSRLKVISSSYCMMIEEVADFRVASRARIAIEK